MLYKELLGYDIRLYKEDYIHFMWSCEERNKFLLKPEVDWPLSAGHRGWPSFFIQDMISSKDGFRPLLFGEMAALDSNYLVKKVRSGWLNKRHELLNLWPDLEEMKRCFLNDTEKIPDRGIVMGLVVISVEPISVHSSWCWIVALNTAKPATIPHGWEFLGYDVGTEPTYIRSALSDFGHFQQEREYWSPKLNSNGLFDDVEEALEYAKLAREFDAGPSDFYLYELHRDPAILVAVEKKGSGLRI